MRYCAALLRLGVGCLCGLLLLGAHEACAQQGSIFGVVSDSAGARLRDVNVGLVGLRQLTRTDEQGRFFFDKVRSGEVEISVRYLGYRPRTVFVMVGAIKVDSVNVTLVAQPTVIEAVSVSAVELRHRQGIEDFYQRRVRGVGAYVTREQIEARRASVTSDALRTMPGIRVVRLRGGQGIRFMTSAIARRDCMPMIWVDGQRAPGMEIDDLPVTTIEGIELYNGPSTTPMQFSQGTDQTTCGTVVVWSRIPG